MSLPSRRKSGRIGIKIVSRIDAGVGMDENATSPACRHCITGS